MKKLLAIAACSMPLLIAPSVYAQTTAPGADTGAANGSSGSTTPGGGTPAAPAPSGSGNDGATPAAAPMNNSTPAGTGASSSSDSAAMTQAITGWSVKDKIMGKTVYNEKDEKIGEISDVVLSSDGKTTYFVVGAGGFLGMGSHDVAIPYDKITRSDDKMTLQGYTKDQLKALPKVEVAK